MKNLYRKLWQQIMLSAFAMGITVAQNLEKQVSNHPMASLKVLIEPRSVPDTITFRLNGEFGNAMSTFSMENEQVLIRTDGAFDFQIPDMGRPVFVSLLVNGHGITPGDRWVDLSNLPIMNSDVLTLRLSRKNRTVQFAGMGSAKLNWLVKARMDNHAYGISHPIASIADEPELFFEKVQERRGVFLNSLEKVKPMLTDQEYSILKADVWAMFGGTLYGYTASINFGHAFKRPGLPERVIKYFEANLLSTQEIDIPEQHLANSAYYAKYMVDYLKSKKAFNNLIAGSSGPEVLDLMDSLFKPGVLKDKIVTTYLVQKNASRLSESELQKGITKISIPKYGRLLNELQGRISKGAEITGFEFYDKSGKQFTLEDLKGKIIVADMWFSGCTGCVGVATGLKLIEQQIGHRDDLVFVSISVDASRDKWVASTTAPEQHVGIEPRYTHYTTAGTLYLWTNGAGPNHPFISRYNPTGSYPRVLLIDKNGRMLKADPPSVITEKGRSQFIEMLNEFKRSQQN